MDCVLPTTSKNIAIKISYRLGRAVDDGLTPTEAPATVSHLLYLTRWPNAFPAVPVVKALFESRAE